MKIISLTDIGVKRQENQDNYWAARLSIDGDEAGVICLCDGMGGLDNGGLASRIVVESVSRYLLTYTDFKGLESVIKEANDKIMFLSGLDNVQMGTTCTVVYCFRGKYKIYHVGDSRCYLLRGDSFEPLTVDHSALVKYGITKDNSPELYKKYKNSLTRCVGVVKNLYLDYYEGEYFEGDSFLCCSDGLWHYLEDFEFEKKDLFDLKTLINKCIDSGETDNITVGILSI